MRRKRTDEEVEIESRDLMERCIDILRSNGPMRMTALAWEAGCNSTKMAAVVRRYGRTLISHTVSEKGKCKQAEYIRLAAGLERVA